jgi:hypothetical protein
LLQSKHSPYRFIGAAFVGTTVHGLSYGNWVYPFYLYIIAASILCAKEIKKQDGKLNTQNHENNDSKSWVNSINM